MQIGLSSDGNEAFKVKKQTNNSSNYSFTIHVSLSGRFFQDFMQLLCDICWTPSNSLKSVMLQKQSVQPEAGGNNWQHNVSSW